MRLNKAERSHAIALGGACSSFGQTPLAGPNQAGDTGYMRLEVDAVYPEGEVIAMMARPHPSQSARTHPSTTVPTTGRVDSTGDHGARELDDPAPLPELQPLR